MNGDSVLNDIESIKQLKARYCRYLDTKDWDRWRELFTDASQCRLNRHTVSVSSGPGAKVAAQLRGSHD
jgi:3-phenylpropionate/cinnamic acid dioxygenase small subunit